MPKTNYKSERSDNYLKSLVYYYKDYILYYNNKLYTRYYKELLDYINK